MSVSVPAMPSIWANRRETTSARSSLFATRMFATRSTPPATEKTSVTPGISAICWPTTSICPRAALMSTTALTIARPRLPSLEPRLALLAERGDALVRVGGRAGQPECPAFEREARVEGHVESANDGVAGQPLGDRRAIGDLAGDRQRGLEQLPRGDAAGREACRNGLLTGQTPPPQDHLHRHRLPDRPNEPLRAARAGDDAEARLGQAEARIVGRDDDVARERELAAAAEHPALAGCHGRRRALLQRLPQRGATTRQELDARHARELVDVGAGREGRALAADHDRADRRVCVEAVERRDELLEERRRQRIAPVGPVERAD